MLSNKDRTNLNWDKTIKKIRRKLAIYFLRDITILGRATLINSMVVNNIIYTSRIIPPYKSHMKSLQNIITAFIKYEKPQGYSNNDIKKAPTQGGFGLPDLETKIQTFHNMWLHYADRTFQ
jgi:hypothetical protein